MNEETEKQIVDELRKLNALVSNYNRTGKLALIILGVFIAIFLATIPFRDRIRSYLASPSQTPETWRQARELLNQGEIQKGKEMIEKLAYTFMPLGQGGPRSPSAV